MGRRSLLERRLQRLERAANAAAERCIFCEQAYWTLISVNDAIGPYSKTRYGNEVGLVASRVLQEARTGETPDYPTHLPAFDLEDDLDEEHEGVMQAVRLVRESRPAREGCECVEAWEVLWSLDARILYHYPAVAEATIKCLQRYAASAPDERILYHFGSPRPECACTPSERLLG
jgi:hypothetical protein